MAEQQYIIEPEKEIKERNRSFFARVAGAITTITSTLITGHFLTQRSLDRWIDIQLRIGDLAVKNAYAEITSGKKILYANDKKTRLKNEAGVVHEPLTIKKPKFLEEAETRFNEKEKEKISIRDDLVAKLKIDNAADKIRLAMKHTAERSALRKKLGISPLEIKKIARKLLALDERKLPQNELLAELEKLTAVEQDIYRVTRLHIEEVNKLASDFAENIEKEMGRCKHFIELERDKILKPAIYKVMKMPEFLGLTHRQADGKTLIRMRAIGAGVAMGVIVYMGTKQFLHRHDYDKYKEATHQQNLAAQRKAANLSSMPSAGV